MYRYMYNVYIICIKYNYIYIYKCGWDEYCECDKFEQDFSKKKAKTSCILLENIF